MKRPLLFIFTLLSTGLYAQEHFSGINTSRRTGIINAVVNPAELTNLKNDHEVNVLNLSVNVSNNKVKMSDLFDSDTDFEELIFSGSEPVNMSTDVEILGPAYAFKHEKWAFAVTTAAKIKANIIDVSPELGRALTTDPTITDAVDIINTNYNQRVSGTAWGEIGFSVARDIYETEEHKISGGVTFKLLFPGSYANMSADQFKGRVTIGTDVVNHPENVGDMVLKDGEANLNFAYSGSLANGFNDMSNFTDFFAGGLNGFAADLGFNYRWKDVNSDDNGYKLNAGVSVRNLGKMTFKDDNNVSNNYTLAMQPGDELNLSQFEDVETIEEVEDLLLQSGLVTLDETNRDFKVKLPSVLSVYGDVKVYNQWYVTGFLQQKLNKANNNAQIAVQNVFTVTPRYSTEKFEAYVPFSTNEISGFTTGVGFRVGGFYMGSGSAITALISDSKQVDAYLGFRFGF
ncbi:DUF5723 family protein [Flavobacterium sp. AG291]|uniref:DUF5723 family protein n=1 Tax=Flavobacterium sp. AG291 TaxID=2184000 RepID=UPI000E0C7B23|nr:DUF5723 family protein [Flavobacterium sp. AG291]RDI14383.1 hypothetical protein DEU42_10275 [Flavobacterium sp. AG291]